MKKTTLLHSEISHAIAGLGYQDLLVISDCGLGDYDVVTPSVKGADPAMAEHTISLNGTWDVQIDFADPAEDASTANLRASWRSIRVPGCWEQIEENKLSDGPVWYRKTFRVPDAWSGQPVAIGFEGVNYYCEIFLNGSLAGTHEGGWSGFELRVEQLLEFRGANQLLIKVYKQGDRFPLRESLAGFLPDVGVIHGGIWKPVTVKVLPEVSVKDVFVKPRIADKGIWVDYRLFSPALPSGQKPQSPCVKLAVRDPKGRIVGNEQQSLVVPALAEPVESSVFVELDGPLDLWSPDSPVLYSIEIVVEIGENNVVHRHSSRFGMKDITILGDQMYLNGNPLYLRGVLHWGWYGDHIAPSPTREEIREELRRVKESGFNLVKHCLYVPIRDYYELADEMGVLLWQELPMWLPEVTPVFKQRVFAQYEDIIREVRNHPSLIVWTLGCELDQSADSTFLAELFGMAKRLTDGAVIRDNSGSGECYGGLLKESADFYDYHFYTDIHFFSDLLGQFAGSWRENKPWMFGEFCDYDEFRDWNRTVEAGGGSIPWWLNSDSVLNPVARDERYQYSRQPEKITQLNLPFSEHHLRENASRSAYVYRKYVLELVRTYRKISGYVITSIKDNPIASSAVFDDLGQPKQQPERFRQINDSTVITLTWDHRRNWVNGGDRLIRWDSFNYTAGELIRPHLFVSHYGSAQVTDGKLQWAITAHGSETSLAQGEIAGIRLYPGEPGEVGVVEIQTPNVAQPTWLKFTAELSWAEGRVVNEWSFCVFPAPQLTPEQLEAIVFDDPLGLFSGLERVYPAIRKMTRNSAWDSETRIVVTSLLRQEHEDFMASGGKVLFVQRGLSGYFAAKHAPFWRESIQLHHAHPVMKAYPHREHTSLSLFGIATDTVFDREALPPYVPVMDRLDARTFVLDSYMIEIDVGLGKMIATTLRFEGGLGSQPTGIRYNPGGRYLLETILQYLGQS